MNDVATSLDNLISEAFTTMNVVIYGLAFVILISGVIFRASQAKSSEEQLSIIYTLLFVVLGMVTLPYCFAKLAGMVNYEMLSFNEVILKDIHDMGTIPVCDETPGMFVNWAFSFMIGIHKGVFMLLLVFRKLLILIQSMFLTLAKTIGPLLISFYMFPVTQQVSIKYCLLSLALSLWGVAFMVADYLTLKVFGYALPFLAISFLPPEVVKVKTFMTLADLIKAVGGNNGIQAFTVAQYISFLNILIIGGLVLLALSIVLNMIGIMVLHSFLGSSMGGAVRSGFGVIMPFTSVGAKVGGAVATSAVKAGGRAVKSGAAAAARSVPKMASNIASANSAAGTGIASAKKRIFSGTPSAAIEGENVSNTTTFSGRRPLANLSDGSTSGTINSPHNGSSNTPAPTPGSSINYQPTTSSRTASSTPSSSGSRQST